MDWWLLKKLFWNRKFKLQVIILYCYNFNWYITVSYLSGDRPFVCDFCNSGFKTKARLRKHQKSHEDDKITRRTVPCPICCKLMKSTKQLIAHMETHDEGSQNPFPCSLCDKSYKNFFSLNFHLKSHGGVKDYKCNLCDKAFTNASHLRRHMNSHTGKQIMFIEVVLLYIVMMNFLFPGKYLFDLLFYIEELDYFLL